MTTRHCEFRGSALFNSGEPGPSDFLPRISAELGGQSQETRPAYGEIAASLPSGSNSGHHSVVELLFDNLGPSARAPDVIAALDSLATVDEAGRGAVFTRPEVAAAILDLAGYTSDRQLHRLQLLEPSFGMGDFLLPALDRMLDAYFLDGGTATRARAELAGSIRAVELHRDSLEQTALRVEARLKHAGLSTRDAQALIAEWLICDDFLLCNLPGEFDVVAGNPPYVRQERIPTALLEEYRHRYHTLYDRADLYVPFYERALELLAPGGKLGFVCSNRWVKNKYGGPLRAMIAQGYQLSHYIDLERVDAFHAQVIAYPAITVIRKPLLGETAPPTRVGASALAQRTALPALVKAMSSPSGESSLVDEVSLESAGEMPWLLDDVPRLKLLRRLEAEFPTLEQAGCRVGIGVATGCDSVFIGDYRTLPVEAARKLPLAMARDLADGELRWGGKGVVNPFEANGRLAALDKYPAFAAYVNNHREAIANRHVAGKNPERWYRTIDRIYPDLVNQPKLLIPDIKGEATVAYDAGNCYPHHNLYYVLSDEWDLRAVQAVLRSSVAVMFVAAYCTRMAGGFLRFQAQYLRRIRIPNWQLVPDGLREELIDAASAKEGTAVDALVFRLYGLSGAEGDLVQRVAHEAQVTGRKRRERQIDDCTIAAR
ncbi:MAG: Eco57I restriction-modification methylase domain-containing protein [Xanthomonadaceae bacterium]|nr:Eco57I restriction-modification methylase domain-containing protein [Xanthomonadaceae bacterium]